MRNQISLFKVVLGLLLILTVNNYSQQKKPDVERCQKKDHDCYIKSYDAQIKENPADAALYLKRGRIFSLRGNYVKAIGDFTKVIELEPENLNAFNERGYAYAVQQKYDVAIRDYSESIRLDPGSTAEIVGRGMAYDKIKEAAKSKADFDLALEILDLEIPLYSSDYDRYLTRAVAYRELREIDKSIADFYQSIQLDPNYYASYRHRGILYLKQSNYALALDDANKAVEFEPDSAESYLLRAKFF